MAHSTYQRLHWNTQESYSAKWSHGVANQHQPRISLIFCLFAELSGSPVVSWHRPVTRASRLKVFGRCPRANQAGTPAVGGPAMGASPGPASPGPDWVRSGTATLAPAHVRLPFAPAGPRRAGQSALRECRARTDGTLPIADPAQSPRFETAMVRQVAAASVRWHQRSLPTRFATDRFRSRQRSQPPAFAIDRRTVPAALQADRHTVTVLVLALRLLLRACKGHPCWIDRRYAIFVR